MGTPYGVAAQQATCGGLACFRRKDISRAFWSRDKPLARPRDRDLVIATFAVPAHCRAPEKVTVCGLVENAVAYDRQVVEVTGFVSHGFEDSTLFDPNCNSRFAIWAEYGGTVTTGTIYCCGVSPRRNRKRLLTIDGVPISLAADKHFRRFDRLLHQPPDAIVHARLVGRFFSGDSRNQPRAPWKGYGHLGCCSLFVIQRALWVDAQDRRDLDYRAAADQPEDNAARAGFRDLLPVLDFAKVIELRRNAEAGERAWAFADPKRVASESLASLAGVHAGALTDMVEVRKANGRVVYSCRISNTGHAYTVVVSRPAWLAPLSNDRQNVSWIAIAAYELSGGAFNPRP
ncbi:MAG TPA: hypothetical protein VFL57_18655 [Bryobacteraceae bacterium]|nr:hypothetical protein [Bryobacteraceae bacterium]